MTYHDVLLMLLLSAAPVCSQLYGPVGPYYGSPLIPVPYLVPTPYIGAGLYPYSSGLYPYRHSLYRYGYSEFLMNSSSVTFVMPEAKSSHLRFRSPCQRSTRRSSWRTVWAPWLKLLLFMLVTSRSRSVHCSVYIVVVLLVTLWSFFEKAFDVVPLQIFQPRYSPQNKLCSITK